jgi:ribosome assembly protein YihI (activator of Der GTPase)
VPNIPDDVEYIGSKRFEVSDVHRNGCVLRRVSFAELKDLVTVGDLIAALSRFNHAKPVAILDSAYSDKSVDRIEDWGDQIVMQSTVSNGIKEE